MTEPTATAVRDVGVLGVGRMGRPMCGHLRAAGFSVHAYDVVPAALDAVVASGVAPAASPAELAERSDVVIVLVGYPEQARAAIAGPDGLLSAAASGTVIVVSSTVGAELVGELAELAAARGVPLLDAPVCRGEDAAVAGDLLWMVGGDAEHLRRCRPVLAACGADIFHVGAVGTGQVAKTINNMLLWAAMCADHEAFALAEAYQIDQEALRGALVGSTASNWALANWERMRHIPWALKDMALALETADAARLSLPVSGVVREVAKSWQWKAGYPS